VYAFLKKPLFWFLTAVSLFAVNLSADTVTFAQFQEAGAGGNDFTFINSGSSAVFESRNPKTGASSVPVTFSFLGFAGNQLPSDLQGPQSAQMSFYIKTTQHVTSLGNQFDQNLYSQNASGLPNYGTITFTRTTPDKELNQTNLLTVSFFAIADGLDGARKGQTATLSADNEANFGPGQIDYVQFSSSYIDFAQGSDENLALSFTSANPCFSIYKNVTAARHGCVTSGTALLNFLHNFTAAGTGTFASDPPPTSVFAVPEPASACLLLLGAPAVIGYLRGRARRSRA
jgi:hypothetical protein